MSSTRAGLIAALLIPTAVSAEDTWTTVRPGVEWLHRVTGGAVPQDIHAVRVDLTLPNVGIRASMDEAGAERGVRTSTFAEDVGALVAINADWSDGFTPIGLAIGNGWLWHDHYDDPNIGGQWGFFACDVWNGCDADRLPPLSEAWWFGAPTRSPYRYYNAVGANGVLLWDDGVRQNGCYDGCAGDSCRHPRTAVCVEQDAQHLWFITIDGRRSGASGMQCGELRDLVADLGCWDAAMLDGGGSTTMWIDGAVRNVPSDGSQRVVSNHLGLIYADSVDPGCAAPAGAFCEGSRLLTCNGGVLVNEGDCAAFGTACQEDGLWAFCVDPRCPNGDGTAAACLDTTRIASCTDGAYGEGDCGVFGLACGTDADGASACMDPRCEAGPNGGFCLGKMSLASCVAGVYGETACEGADHCVEVGSLASCEAPEPTPGDDDSASSEPTPIPTPRPDQVGWGQGCTACGGGGASLLPLIPFGFRRGRQPWAWWRSSSVGRSRQAARAVGKETSSGWRRR